MAGRADLPQAWVDILLVDDNALDARAALTAARRLQVADAIRRVPDGPAALEWLRAGAGRGPTTGLVLLDLNLPGPDGHEVLAEIRSDPVLGATPVVVLTSSDDQREVTRAYRRGANAFITKPDDLDGWMRVLATIDDFWRSTARLPHR